MRGFFTSLVMLASAFGGVVRAETVVFNSQPDWAAAVGNDVTVFHFDGPTETNGLYADDPQIDPSYSSQGVAFLPFTGTNILPMILRNQQVQIPYSDGDGLLTNVSSPNPASDLDGRAIKFDFNQDARAVGMFFNGYPGGAGDGGYIAAYDVQGALLGKVDVGAADFGGIISDQLVHHVEVVNTFDSDITFGIYDLQFSPVPEPSTLVLLGIGAIGLFAWRRRQAA
jgi:hypothetical protein